MSDREDTPERQENGSHQSNGDHTRGSQSPGRSISRSRKRHHSRSRSSPRERRSPYEGSSYGGRGSERPRGVGGGSTTGSTGYDGNKYREPYPPSKRSRSRSPMSGRRRHTGNRENPPAGRCLGIFGLSIYTQERDLHQVFSKYGPIEDVQIVYDAQTGRSRGFSFVYFKHTEDAKAAKDNCNGIEIDGRKIRVDFSITQRAHTPTPGIYMGKPSHPRHRGGRNERGDRGGGGGGDFRGPERVDYYGHREPVYHQPRERSPSPYFREKRRGYPRSRSRSYSPRKYQYY